MVQSFSSPGSGSRKEKKMLVTDYLPAIVKKNSHGWYVEYQVVNPSTGKMKRYRQQLNNLRKHYARLSDFKEHCNRIVCTINAKLAGGWSPVGENINTRLYTPLSMVISDYLDEKSAELRPDTMRSYRSFCTSFGKWVEETAPGCQAVLFNKVLAIRYLDYCFKERKLKGRSWNNRLKSASALFSWAVEKCYCKENPFAGIKTKREEEKKRVLVPPEARIRISDWCRDHNPGLLIVSHLVYSSLIRPKEIRGIRVGDVFLDKHYIHIRPEVSKTHYARFSSLSPELEEALSGWIGNAKSSDYLIGRDYRSCSIQQSNSRFVKDWEKMRNALDLPEEMQLYSLRDTGINEMLKSGIDPLTVMQHADHHDLSITTRYANHADPHLVEVISARAPRF